MRVTFSSTVFGVMLRWLPVRVVLRLGLSARYLLSRVSGRTAEGAAPTRSAELLKKVS